MRLGLSQAAYRWVSYPGLRIDQPEYGFRGLEYPYGTTTEPPAELEGALEWWIERCREWGFDNLYTAASLLDGKEAAAANGRLLAENGIEWVGSVNGAWAVDSDEWAPVHERAAMHLEWMQAGGVRTSAMVNADPPGPPGQPMPNGGLRFGHFSTETPIGVQIDRMIENLSKLVVDAEKCGIVLAFENHMDYRISEIVQVVEGVGSPWLRINYDFSNSLAVVEDQVDAANQLLPAVGIDPIDHDGSDVEGVWNGAAREREPALNVLEVQAVFLALLLEQSDQFPLEFFFRTQLAHLDKKIRLSRDRSKPGLLSPVAVGAVKALDGRPRHQETLQDAALDHWYALPPHALVVVAIRTRQVRGS